MRPSILIFGQESFDEREPGLGLMISQVGVRLFGKRFRNSKEPAEGDCSWYCITPILQGEQLERLIAYFNNANNSVEQAPFELAKEEAFFLRTCRESTRFQKVVLGCGAFDSLYFEELGDLSWGISEVEIHVRWPAFQALFVVLRMIQMGAITSGE